MILLSRYLCIILTICMFILIMTNVVCAAYDMESADLDNYVNASEFHENCIDDVSYSWNVTKEICTPAGDKYLNNTTTDEEFLTLYQSRNVINKTNDGEIKKLWFKQNYGTFGIDVPVEVYTGVLSHTASQLVFPKTGHLGKYISSGLVEKCIAVEKYPQYLVKGFAKYFGYKRKHISKWACERAGKFLIKDYKRWLDLNLGCGVLVGIDILLVVYNSQKFTLDYLSNFKQGNATLKELENYAKYHGYYHSRALMNC